MKRFVVLILSICIFLTSCQNQENKQPIDENYYDFFRENEFTQVSNLSYNASLSGLSVWSSSGCTDIDIYFGQNVIIGIEYKAFRGKSIRSICLPESTRWIEGLAFENCTQLAYILIPKEIESISSNAFAGCTGIEHVYFTGDEWDFRMIDLGGGNELLENANIHYNYVYPEIKEATK